MTTNDAGIKIIQTFEGCSLTAYLCPAKKWTIGYGHTGADVHEGMTITPEKAMALLKADLIWAERAVEHLVTAPVNSDQFSALVCLTYNIGMGNFQSSTLLKKLNGGDPCADEFLSWNKIGGVESPGLTRRRQAERALFLSR